MTPASGSESIFEQGFSFGEAASSQSVSFEAGHLNKGIRFYPFLIAVCTANHYSEPVHRCLPASKPFPDIRAQRNAPYVGFG